MIPNPNPQTERLALLSSLPLLPSFPNCWWQSPEDVRVVLDFSVPMKTGTVYSKGGFSLGFCIGQKAAVIYRQTLEILLARFQTTAIKQVLQ